MALRSCWLGMVAAVALGCWACTAPQSAPPPDQGSRPPIARATTTATLLKKAECPVDGLGVVPPYEGGVAVGVAPHGFVPTRVMLCVAGQKASQAPDGKMHYTVRQRSGPYTAELGKALELPNTGLSDPNATCPAFVVSDIYLLLVNAEGRAYRTDIPVDYCGQPLPEVTTALKNLTLRTDRTFSVVGKK